MVLERRRMVNGKLEGVYLYTCVLVVVSATHAGKAVLIHSVSPLPPLARTTGGGSR